MASTRQQIDEERQAVLRTGPRDGKFWPVVKTLMRENGAQDGPVKSADGVIATCNDDKAKVFASQLQSIMCSPGGNEDVLQVSATAEEMEDLNHQVSVEEVHTIVKHLKTGKAPGADGIVAEMLKQASLFTLSCLAALFSASLSLRYFPSRWKRGVVAMLPKDGKDQSLASNFRPITLNPVIGKVLERIVNKRLMRFADENELIPECQAGFHPGRNSTEQVVLLVQRAVQAMNAGLVTAVVAMDVAKAYDSVWHASLLTECAAGLPPQMVEWIASFLDNRKLQVRVGNSLSEPFVPTAGVPQGSPLSPFLYSVFTRNVPVPPTSVIKGSSLYADDICVWASGPNPMAAWQSIKPHLETVSTWCDDHALQINAGKTQLTFLSRQRAWPASAFPRATFRNCQLDHGKTLDLLGVRLDASLTCGAHARLVSARVAPRMQRLRTAMSMNRQIPRWVGVLLYKTMIRPCLLFAAPVLLLASERARRPLDVAERRGLRAVLRCPISVRVEDLHRRSGIRPFMEEYAKASGRFLTWCAANDNRRLLRALTCGIPRRTDLVYWRPLLERCLEVLDPWDRARVLEAVEDMVDPLF